MRRILSRLLSDHTVYLLRIDLHFLFLRVRNFIFLRSARKIKVKSRHLNLACGSCGVMSPNWFNLDGWPADSVDYTTDLRKKLPFPEGRFDGIFCEHFFEHLTPYDRGPFLRECLRVLKASGTLRISVPDGALYFEKYFNDRPWMSKRRGGGKSSMVVVNDVFRQHYEHEYCYDAETLIGCLVEAGFVDVEAEQFGNGRDKSILIDQEWRSFESLYVEGSKVLK